MKGFNMNQNQEIANNILNFFDPTLGFPGGSFCKKLLSTIASADNHNRSLLSTVYPLHVLYFNTIVYETDGYGKIKEIASNS